MTLKKPHAADEYDRRNIARAVGFTAHARNGPACKRTIRCKTLPEARTAAARLLREFCRGGRHPGVYAITPEGWSIFVPDDFTPEGEDPQMIEKLAALERTWNNPSAARMWLTRNPHDGLKVSFDPDNAVYRLVEKTEPAAIEEPVLAGAIDAVGAKAEAEAEAVADALDANKTAGGDAAHAEAPKAKGKAPRLTAKYLAMLDAAKKGTLPTPPDFSAETHKYYREKLKKLIDAAVAGDIAALNTMAVEPKCSTRIAMERYRTWAIIAIEAGAPKEAA